MVTQKAKTLICIVDYEQWSHKTLFRTIDWIVRKSEV
jgi:hypothetical protein